MQIAAPPFNVCNHYQEAQIIEQDFLLKWQLGVTTTLLGKEQNKTELKMCQNYTQMK